MKNSIKNSAIFNDDRFLNFITKLENGSLSTVIYGPLGGRQLIIQNNKIIRLVRIGDHIISLIAIF